MRVATGSETGAGFFGVKPDPYFAAILVFAGAATRADEAWCAVDWIFQKWSWLIRYLPRYQQPVIRFQASRQPILTGQPGLDGPEPRNPRSAPDPPKNGS